MCLRSDDNRSYSFTCFLLLCDSSFAWDACYLTVGSVVHAVLLQIVLPFGGCLEPPFGVESRKHWMTCWTVRVHSSVVAHIAPTGFGACHEPNVHCTALKLASLACVTDDIPVSKSA